MAEQSIEKGDQVAWQWSGNKPGGEAAEVKADEVSITSHRGNEIKKKGDENDPAVHIARPGNDVVKKASELEVQEKAPENKANGGDAKKDEGLKVPKGGRGKSKSKSPAPPAASKPEERKEDEAEKPKEEEEKKAEAPKSKPAPAKKEAPATNGDGAKKAGRPKGAAGAGEKKKEDKPKKRAATETGEPRRSKRLRA